MNKKEIKQLDSEISSAFAVHFDRVQIPIMDIPKIYARARSQAGKGLTMDHVVEQISKEYKNGN